MNSQKVEEREGSAFILRPSIKPEVGRVEKNIKKLKDLYELGYTDAQIHYDALISFERSRFPHLPSG